MDSLPFLVSHRDQAEVPKQKREYVKKNKAVPDSDIFEEVKPKRKYFKKSRPVKTDNVEIKEEIRRNEVGEEHVVVKPKRKYVRRDKASMKKNQTSVEIKEVGGEDAGDEAEELDVDKGKRAKKFADILIHGFVNSALCYPSQSLTRTQNSIAVDHSEFMKLIRKVIHIKGRKQKPQGWQEVCSTYKSLLSIESKAMEAELNAMSTIISRGYGHLMIEKSLETIGLTDIVVLALEAVEEVSKTWKNAHTIFLSAKMALKEMQEFVNNMEFRWQDPDYWWSKKEGFTLHEIPWRACEALQELREEEDMDMDYPEVESLGREDGEELMEGIGLEFSNEDSPGLDFSNWKDNWWE
jgi:hypothetical protein